MGGLAPLAAGDREAGRELLLERGLRTAAADDVLASTHCEAPPVYLIVSSAMAVSAAWKSIGAWDPLGDAIEAMLKPASHRGFPEGQPFRQQGLQAPHPGPTVEAQDIHVDPVAPL